MFGFAFLKQCYTLEVVNRDGPYEATALHEADCMLVRARIVCACAFFVFTEVPGQLA